MARTLLMAFVLIAILIPSGTTGSEEKKKIEVGKPAPDFTLKNQEGKDVKISSFRGKKNVLIAFYPKDFTGG